MDPLDWFLIFNFYVMLGSSPSWVFSIYKLGRKAGKKHNNNFRGQFCWWPFWDGDPWPELKGYISDLPTIGDQEVTAWITWLLCCFFLRKKKSGIGHSKRWRPWSDRWSWRLQVGSFGADRQLISGVVLLFHPCKWPKINGFRWGEITFTYNLQARICLFLVIFLRIGIPWDEIFTIKPATIRESMFWNCFPSFFCKSKITVENNDHQESRIGPSK